MNATVIEFSTYPKGSPFTAPNSFRRGKVLDVHDGDTVHVTLDLAPPGLNLQLTNERVRLAGINAPELSGEAGVQSKQHLEALCETSGAFSDCEIEILGRDNYGRLLAVIWGTDAAGKEFSINEKMVSDGFAKVLEEGRT